MRSAQRGASMVEALVALLLLGLGLVTYANLQARTQHALLQHRLRQAALQLARQSLEQTLHDSRVAGADVADGQTTVSIDQTPFLVTRSLLTMNSLSTRLLNIDIQWTDPDGHAQSIQLDSVVASIDPELTRALFTEPPPTGP